MKVYTNSQLNNHLNEKGIAKKRGDGITFLKNDYFQVVNGYKTLFVCGVENIDLIMNNIDSNIDIARYKKAYSIISVKDNNELKSKIVNRICEKYDITDKTNAIDTIRNLNYVHHIYDSNCTYNDFLRMYEFEHDLRCILLKYTLKIENNLKRVFIATLNDTDKMKDNFLTDIDSYNTSFKAHNDSIKTLKSVLDLHNSNHSKPIERKVHQDIIVPYWILINEMTFGVVINCIKNLKTELSNSIYENLIKNFTNVSLSFKNKSDYNNIDNFKKILDYIGSFRNMLAHNQPIFTYNIKDDSLCNFPTFTYSQPQVSKKNVEFTMSKYSISKTEAYIKCQQNKNNHMKTTCSVLFGKDSFNLDKNPSNMNLSYIIYFLYKINKNIEPKCTMKEELLDVFYRYNIIEHIDRYHITDIGSYKTLVKKIENLNLNLDYTTMVTNVRKSINLRNIQSSITATKNDIKAVKSDTSSIDIELVERLYDDIFKFDSAYQKFTGINPNFLKKL